MIPFFFQHLLKDAGKVPPLTVLHLAALHWTVACISNISRNTKLHQCKFSVADIYTFKLKLFSAIRTLSGLSVFNSRSEAIELFLLKQGNNNATLSNSCKAGGWSVTQRSTQTQPPPPTQWSKEWTCWKAPSLVQRQQLFRCLRKNRGLLLLAPL